MIFAGVISGLIAFGLVGLFIGPVVLAATFILLQTWISEGGLQGGLLLTENRRELSHKQARTAKRSCLI